MLPDGPIAIGNLTRGTIVANTARSACGLWGQLVGLLGCSVLPAGAGLIFSPCMGLHTIGMRFPIDLVYLRRDDSDGCGGVVVRLREDLGPFRVALARADLVVELPSDTIARTSTTVGDQIAMWAVADRPVMWYR